MKPSEIVDYIEQTLTEKGKTKTEFYEATGISAAVFSNWRKEKNRPSLDALDAVNAYLGTSFGIELEENKKEYTNEGELSFITRVRNLPPDRKKLLQAFLDTLEGLDE